MGINRPSLYAAFGNKESLFRKVLERYVQGPAGYMGEALKEPQARTAIERFLIGAADLLCDSANPRGCLVVQGALACGDEAEGVRQALVTCRKAGETLVRERLERAITEGDLPESANAADLARFFTTVVHGMSVQAASGAGRENLQGVIDTAMRAWPG